MPGTDDVGKNIKELYDVKRNPSQSSEPDIAAKRPRAQIIAIAESQARRATKLPAMKRKHKYTD